MRYTTDAKSDKEAIIVASQYSGEGYQLVGDNCDDLVVNAIRAAGVKFKDRWRPIKTYKANKKSADFSGKWNPNE